MPRSHRKISGTAVGIASIIGTPDDASFRDDTSHCTCRRQRCILTSRGETYPRTGHDWSRLVVAQVKRFVVS